MIRHHTPLEVAKRLARYAPKRVMSLLDPSMGEGVLVEPLLGISSLSKVVCIDIDRKVTSALRRQKSGDERFAIFTTDFLTWCDSLGRKERFDCIIMNPPFGARKSDQVRLQVEIDSKTKAISSPIEGAFVYKAAGLLKPGGRMLAILPASVVASEGGTWLRSFLMRTGCIKLVHELPPRTFSGVEGRMYLLVYERGSRQLEITLRNHRLLDPDEIILSSLMAKTATRLDFAFYEAKQWSEALARSPGIQWAMLRDVASIWRGTVPSPIISKSVLHTTNFYSFVPSPKKRTSLERMIAYNDIVCKRVARGCSSSFKLYPDKNPTHASDCIFAIRPIPEISAQALLFSIRTLVATAQGAALIEKGLGATYISQDSLENLSIPVSLSSAYPRHYQRYLRALRSSDRSALERIEEEVRTLVSRSR